MLIIPDKGQEEDNENRVIKYLDERMLETPSIAFGNTIKEVLEWEKTQKKSLVFLWMDFKKISRRCKYDI